METHFQQHPNWCATIFLIIINCDNISIINGATIMLKGKCNEINKYVII